jgi:RNase H-fold protein (predicted Holliday junction resolvase)
MKLWRDYFQSLNQNLAQLDKITKTKYILTKIVNNYRDFWQQDDLQPAISQACDDFEKTPVCAVDHNTVYIENPSLAENLQKYFKKYQTAHKVNAGIPHTIKTNSINESKAIMKLVETLQPNTQLPATTQDIFYRYARMKTLQAMPYRQKPGI